MRGNLFANLFNASSPPVKATKTEVLHAVDETGLRVVDYAFDQDLEDVPMKPDYRLMSDMINELAKNPKIASQLATLEAQNPKHDFIERSMITSAGAFVEAAAEKPLFAAAGHTMLVENMLRDFSMTPSERPNVARPIIDRADLALRENSERILSSFGQTSDDPYISARQEESLRGEIRDIERLSNRLDNASGNISARADTEHRVLEERVKSKTESFMSNPEGNRHLLQEIAGDQELLAASSGSPTPANDDKSQNGKNEKFLEGLLTEYGVNCSWVKGIAQQDQQVDNSNLGKFVCTAAQSQEAATQEPERRGR